MSFARGEVGYHHVHGGETFSYMPWDFFHYLSQKNESAHWQLGGLIRGHSQVGGLFLHQLIYYLFIWPKLGNNKDKLSSTEFINIQMYDSEGLHFVP